MVYYIGNVYVCPYVFNLINLLGKVACSLGCSQTSYAAKVIWTSDLPASLSLSLGLQNHDTTPSG